MSDEKKNKPLTKNEYQAFQNMKEKFFDKNGGELQSLLVSLEDNPDMAENLDCFCALIYAADTARKNNGQQPLDSDMTLKLFEIYTNEEPILFSMFNYHSDNVLAYQHNFEGLEKLYSEVTDGFSHKTYFETYPEFAKDVSKREKDFAKSILNDDIEVTTENRKINALIDANSILVTRARMDRDCANGIQDVVFDSKLPPSANATLSNMKEVAYSLKSCGFPIPDTLTASISRETTEREVDVK